MTTSNSPHAHNRGPAVLAAGVLGVLAAGCGGSGDASPPTAQPTERDDVVVTDMSYQPASLTISAGDTVTWQFDDGAIRHDVAGDGFQSEIVAEGTFHHTFDEPGTYEYVCTLHPNMTGTVEVAG